MAKWEWREGWKWAQVKWLELRFFLADPRPQIPDCIYVKRMDDLLPPGLTEMPDLKGTMIGAVTPPPIIIGLPAV